MVAPVIELYFDGNVFLSGRQGGYRARLRDCYGCHSAGLTPGQAVASVVRTAVSFADMRNETSGELSFAGLPSDPSGYEIVRLDPISYKSILDRPWDFVDEASNQDEIDAARFVANFMFNIHTRKGSY